MLKMVIIKDVSSLFYGYHIEGELIITRCSLFQIEATYILKASPSILFYGHPIEGGTCQRRGYNNYLCHILPLQGIYGVNVIVY